MSKASENALGALHGAVATALAQRLTAPIRNADGEAIPGTEGSGCSAADITAAIAFLKNNNISADPTDSPGLSDLKALLTARRHSGKESLQTKQDALAGMGGYLSRAQ
jgi:hypothetical protein